jgi:hypothetical protein
MLASLQLNGVIGSRPMLSLTLCVTVDLDTMR